MGTSTCRGLSLLPSLPQCLLTPCTCVTLQHPLWGALWSHLTAGDTEVQRLTCLGSPKAVACLLASLASSSSQPSSQPAQATMRVASCLCGYPEPDMPQILPEMCFQWEILPKLRDNTLPQTTDSHLVTCHRSLCKFQDCFAHNLLAGS